MKKGMTHETRITLAMAAIVAISCAMMYYLSAKEIHNTNSEMWGKFLSTFDVQNLKDFTNLKINTIGLYVALSSAVVSAIAAIINAVLWFRQFDYNRSRDQKNDEKERKDKIQSENHLTLVFRNEIIESLARMKYIEGGAKESDTIVIGEIYRGEESLARFVNDFDDIFRIIIEKKAYSEKTIFPETGMALTQIAVLLEAFIVQAVNFENESIKFAHIMLITAFSVSIYDACENLKNKASKLKYELFSSGGNGDKFGALSIILDHIIQSTEKIENINNRFRVEYLSRGLPLT